MRARLNLIAILAIIGWLSSACVFLDRVSLTSTNAQIAGSSTVTDVSSDGRYVVFQTAEQLDPDDTGPFVDVFRRDTLLGTTTRISEATDVLQIDVSVANGDSYDGRISDDGSAVVFTTDATNMYQIAGLLQDSNGQPDVAVYRNATSQANYVSIFVGCNGTCASTANGASTNPTISSDGTGLAFESTAQLVLADTNDLSDIYRPAVPAAAGFELISLTSLGLLGNGGSHNPSIGPNGEVAFSTDASNMFPSDGNGVRDIALHDDGATTRISEGVGGVSTNGASDHPHIAGGADLIAFESDASNIIAAGDNNGVRDIFIADYNGAAERTSRADDGSELTSASSVQGVDDAGDRVLWSNNNMSWVRDRAAQTTELVSTDRDGNPHSSTAAAISSLGSYVAFSSVDAIESEDTNGALDVYLRAYGDPRVDEGFVWAVLRDESTFVVLSGRGFSDVTSVTSPDTDIDWNNVIVVDDTTIIATVSVSPTATLGLAGVHISVADGGPGQYSGSFEACQCLDVIS